jgi:hypothetical protein
LRGHIVVLSLSLLIPLTANAQGAGSRKAKKHVTAKVPVELAEQLIRGDESIRQAISRVPGANATILAQHLVAELIDLNFDASLNTLSMGRIATLAKSQKWWCNCDEHQYFGGLDLS